MIKTKQELKTILNNCLNILRDNEHKTGDNALRPLTYLLVLKFIEPQFENFNIDDYNFDDIEDDKVEDFKKKLTNCVKFSNLIKVDIENVPYQLGELWDYVLSKNVLTKNIFLKGDKFDFKNISTYKNLLKNLSLIDLSNFDFDILGEVYEEIIKNIMTGKVLGQFFTPPEIKNIMVDLIKPKLFNNGTTEIIFDPALGTGGFLLTLLKNIKSQATENNVAIDWNFISKNFSGREAETHTYQLAMANMFITTGHIFNLENGDSIRKIIPKEMYDIVITNPPYGISMVYDDIKLENKDEYLPIKTSSAVSLFLQAIIYMLKIDGRCAVVLPNGRDIYGKSEKSLIAVREYLLKTCNLKKIIYLPSNIFTNTSIETCIFYFIKKRSSDIFVNKSTLKKNQSMFSENDHQTKKIKFFNYTNQQLNLILTVPIEKIIENKYSLDYKDYKQKHVTSDHSITFKKINDLVIFESKSKKLAGDGNLSGPYKFFTSSSTILYCNEADYSDGSYIIIGTGGNANIKFCDTPFSCSGDNFVLRSNDNNLIKYIYHYLINNISILQDGFKGTALKHISAEYTKNINIPILSVDQQNKLIEIFDRYDNKKNLELQYVNILEQNNKDYINAKIMKVKEIFKISDICTFCEKSKDKASEGNEEGKFKFYTSSNKIMYCDKPRYENNEYLIIGTGGNANIKFCDTPFSCSGDNFVLRSSDKVYFLTKYIYYYLFSNLNILQDGFKGTALKHISIDYIKNIEIPIPSIELQNEIINYCDQNNKFIDAVIENSKKTDVDKQFYLDTVFK